jgi:hypothetical protein
MRVPASFGGALAVFVVRHGSAWHNLRQLAAAEPVVRVLASSALATPSLSESLLSALEGARR